MIWPGSANGRCALPAGGGNDDTLGDLVTEGGIEHEPWEQDIT